jgi:hypothetical protein
MDELIWPNRSHETQVERKEKKIVSMAPQPEPKKVDSSAGTGTQGALESEPRDIFDSGSPKSMPASFESTRNCS